jgi:hypothetical protein
MPSMTRAHFKLIADAVADLPPLPTKEQVARSLSAGLRSTNPNFNPSRFLEACGVTL